MTFLELKTLLIAGSLLGGGAITGATDLDAGALAAVHEAMGGAPQVSDVDVPVSSAAAGVEAAANVSVEAVVGAVVAEGMPGLSPELGREPAETGEAGDAEAEAPTSETAADSGARPGRRVVGASGRGVEHRSERATAALDRAGARSPLSNAGAEHRNEHATVALTRAAARSATPAGRASEGRGAENRGRGRGPRS